MYIDSDKLIIGIYLIVSWYISFGFGAMHGFAKGMNERDKIYKKYKG